MIKRTYIPRKTKTKRKFGFLKRNKYQKHILKSRRRKGRIYLSK